MTRRRARRSSGLPEIGDVNRHELLPRYLHAHPIPTSRPSSTNRSNCATILRAIPSSRRSRRARGTRRPGAAVLDKDLGDAQIRTPRWRGQATRLTLPSQTRRHCSPGAQACRGGHGRDHSAGRPGSSVYGNVTIGTSPWGALGNVQRFTAVAMHAATASSGRVLSTTVACATSPEAGHRRASCSGGRRARPPTSRPRAVRPALPLRARRFPAASAQSPE